MPFSQQTYQGQGIVPYQADNRSGQILGQSISSAAQTIAQAIGRKKEKEERNKILSESVSGLKKFFKAQGVELDEGLDELGVTGQATYLESMLEHHLPELQRQKREQQMQEQYSKAAESLGLPKDLHPELFDDVLRGQQQQAQAAAMLQRLGIEMQAAEEERQFKKDYQERQIEAFNQPKPPSITEQIAKQKAEQEAARGARQAKIATPEFLASRLLGEYRDTERGRNLVAQFAGQPFALDNFGVEASKMGMYREQGTGESSWLDEDSEDSEDSEDNKNNKKKRILYPGKATDRLNNLSPAL